MSKKIYNILRGRRNPAIDVANARIHELWACDYIKKKKLCVESKLVDDKNKKMRKHKDIFFKESLKARNKRLEVKREAETFNTGNLFFETSSHSKLSGLLVAKGKVDWWFESFLCDDGVMRFGIAKVTDAYKLVFSGKFPVHNSAGDRFKSGRAATGILVPWKEFSDICFWTDSMKAEKYVKQLEKFK